MLPVEASVKTVSKPKHSVVFVKSGTGTGKIVMLKSVWSVQPFIVVTVNVMVYVPSAAY